MSKKEEIERNVIKAMKAMVSEDTSATFAYTLVPSKRLADGGLGVKWNGWHAMLNSLRRHLPEGAPYASLAIDVMLVDTTYNKSLQSLRYWLVGRLLLIDKHGVKP